MRHKTTAGILLEKLLRDNKQRYLWCWNGESNESYDCACCMTWWDEKSQCGCICHERIEEMASHPHITLWLLALESMCKEELRPTFSSYAEKLEYSKAVYAKDTERKAEELEHAQGRWRVPDCKCEYCEFVREDVHRLFKLPGEEGYIDDIVEVPTEPVQ